MVAEHRHEQAPATAAPGERWWRLLWVGFFALTLAAPTAFALSDAPSAEHGVVTLGIAAAFGLWHWQTALRRPEWVGRATMLLWFAGALVFVWLLLGRHDSYLFLLYGLFPALFGLLNHLRYTAPAVVALIVLVFWRTGVTAAEPTSEWMISMVGSVLLALLIGVFVTTLERQSTSRQRALEELQATREELATTSRRAGVLEERERLAREIHDTVAQGFTGIVMQLEASEQALDTHPDQVRQHLDRAKRSARESLTELRRAVHAMRPEALEGATLTEAVARSVRRWADETGIAADMFTEGVPVPLHPNSEIALLRTSQEGLANVARHADATKATVRLTYSPTQVVLTVDDDGVGFDPTDRDASDGRGLNGIAERMAALNGRMRLDSRPGAGTTLTAQVPAPTSLEKGVR